MKKEYLTRDKYISEDDVKATNYLHVNADLSNGEWVREIAKQNPDHYELRILPNFKGFREMMEDGVVKKNKSGKVQRASEFLCYTPEYRKIKVEQALENFDINYIFWKSLNSKEFNKYIKK